MVGVISFRSILWIAVLEIPAFSANCWRESPPPLLSVLILVPIFETTLVTVTRLLTGRRLSQGGRDHASHRLVVLGLSEVPALMEVVDSLSVVPSLSDRRQA